MKSQEHLERIEQVVDIEEDKACPCCGGALHPIGEDVSERLDVVPATFRVLVTRRPRYGCRSCESGVVQAPAPARIVEGGIPTEALIAQVLVSKYADHLPLYRQAQIYARQGVQLDRSTLADWVGRAAWYLRPLRDHVLERLRRSERLFADETTAPVLDPGRGRTKTGQLWAYARDDRPWSGNDPPMVAYVYAADRKPVLSLSRGRSGPTPISAILPAFCRSMAMAGTTRSPGADRRSSSRSAGHMRAADSTSWRTARRLQPRSCAASPRFTQRWLKAGVFEAIVDDLRHYLDARNRQVSGKSKLGEAIRYALTRWDGLSRFLDDGRIDLDSNAVERSIRPLALNRKNALFAGSDEGGDNWAVIATLIECCKISAINPHD